MSEPIPDSSSNGNNMRESDRKLRRNSTGSDESPVHMRIGSEYQASIPPLETSKKVVSRGPALVIWKPYPKLPDHVLLKFLEYARTKYGYREEQALGLLVCHRYNVEEANKDLVNFVPYPDDWTSLEKQTFEHGFQEHGKDFHKIKMMLPDKSVSNIVKYYYIWKKTRSKYQTLKNKMKARRADSDDDSYDDLNDHKNKRIRMGSSSLMTSTFTQSQMPIIQALYNTGSVVNEPCTNCHRAKAVMLLTLKKEHLLCIGCSDYYQKYSTMRPLFELSIISTGESHEKGVLNPPDGVDLTLDSLKLVACTKDAHHYLACLTNQILTHKHHLLEKKLDYKRLTKAFNKLDIEQYRESVTPPSISKGWTDHEIEMLKLSFINYGKDFDAAAIIVGSKSASQCRSTYYTKKDKYNFEECFDQYEEKLVEMKPEEDTNEGNKENKENENDDELEILSATPSKKPTDVVTANSPDLVFRMHINGITQPVRLQRIPIQTTQSIDPVVIDLTDDDDDTSQAGVELKISASSDHVNYIKNAITKVVDSIHIMDDEIQIIDSNGMT